MKLTITKSELLSLVQNNINNQITEVAVVGEKCKHDHFNIWRHHKMRLLSDNSNKIDLIKSLREQIPGLGLADAKYAIEAEAKQIKDFLAAKKTLIGFSVF